MNPLQFSHHFHGFGGGEERKAFYCVFCWENGMEFSPVLWVGEVFVFVHIVHIRLQLHKHSTWERKKEIGIKRPIWGRPKWELELGILSTQ
jgi:hypothetical protein